MPLPVTYIVSNIDKALAFEWVALELDRQQFELSFVLLNPGDSVLETFLRGRGVDVLQIEYRGKKDLPGAVLRIARYLRERKTRVVHCHLFDACVAGLVAARLAGVKIRIYTRHHSTLHHQFFPRAVRYDQFINGLATHIVAISENVQHVLTEKEKACPDKIRVINHGFRLEVFGSVSPRKVELIRNKYGIRYSHPIIGVISRYTEWKGIQYIIPAFKRLLQNGYPHAKLILANASGDYAPMIRRALSELPAESYVEIPFEGEVPALYQLFDVYVHVPINPQIEAFGQTYIEALAARVPSVFTLSGVASEFIEHERNALVVPFQDADSIHQAIMRLLGDGVLRERLREQGVRDVERFALNNMIDQLQRLYMSGTTAKR